MVFQIMLVRVLSRRAAARPARARVAAAAMDNCVGLHSGELRCVVLDSVHGERADRRLWALRAGSLVWVGSLRPSG